MLGMEDIFVVALENVRGLVLVLVKSLVVSAVKRVWAMCEVRRSDMRREDW